MSSRSSRGRRMLGKIRRGRFASDDAPAPVDPPRPSSLSPGWEHTARPTRENPTAAQGPAPLREQILALFADPRVDTVTLESVASSVNAPLQDVETTLHSMLQAGELIAAADGTRRYSVPTEEKAQLESMFRAAAHELGEPTALVRPTDDALATLEDEAEEPRLPVTAGLLSLFLPGTGQLLNGDVGRASLVFAVWSLAWITHLSPVWTFVCLYAGAEAFFTAKIRSMERKMAKEAIAAGNAPPALPPGAKPSLPSAPGSS